MRVNKLVNKMVKEVSSDENGDLKDEAMDPEAMCKMHKKNIKYAEKSMQDVREEIEAAISSWDDAKDKEKIIKAKAQLRKLQSFESLFLNINLLLLAPQNLSGDQKNLIDTLEDIEELKQCFENMRVNVFQASGKVKKLSEDQVKE